MKKIILTILVLSLLSVLCLASFASAAITVTMITPVTRTNYTTLTWNCTTNVLPAPSGKAYNVSIRYNVTGGSTTGANGISLETVSNASGAQTEFIGTGSIEALGDALIYNFSCYGDNGTTQKMSPAVAVVGIDNTAPTKTLTWDKPSVVFGSPHEISWTTADATSGIASVSVAVVPPNTDKCISQTYTDEDFTAKQFLDTDCDGTYTVTLTATDTAGNVATKEDTFDVLYPGAPVAGGLGSDLAGSLGQKAQGTKGTNTKTIVIFGVLVAVIYFLIIKKK